MLQTFTEKEVSYDFRNKPLVLPDFSSIRYGKQSFKYYGAHLWNNRPANFKAADTVRAFKRLVKEWQGPTCMCNLCFINFSNL